MNRFLPFTDLAEIRSEELVQDVKAALAVAFLCIPQGVAYAMIAGLPPAMGLYAGAIPAIIASLMRSSRHVISGPTNAVSLLVGTAVAAGLDAPPAQVAVTLALMVGLMQLAAGLFRLGNLVNFISSAVVLGFISGAGVLIGLGQLPNVTATEVAAGPPWARFLDWLTTLGDSDPKSIALALGTATLIIALRRIDRFVPAAFVGLGVATAITMVFDLESKGFQVIKDLAPINAGLPPLSMPQLGLFGTLLPLAAAVTVLCMVESSSMARSIAHRSGQRLDVSTELTGEGLANIVGSFFSAYPVTGSLSRSALNEREGANSRIAGIVSGFIVLLVPLALSTVLDHVPIAGLAGLLIVVAARIVDTDHIARIFRSHIGDRIPFIGTFLATLVVPLDQAIYLGVGISLFNFLHRARLVGLRDLTIDSGGRLREVSTRTRVVGPEGFSQPSLRYCRGVHLLNVQGSLFFAAAPELDNAIDEILANPEIKVLILRIKRVRNLDVTTISVLEGAVRRLETHDRQLYLLGMSEGTMEYFERTGFTDRIGAHRLFPSSSDHWFAAMEDAVKQALEAVGQHECGEDCPLQGWLDRRLDSLAETGHDSNGSR